MTALTAARKISRFADRSRLQFGVAASAVIVQSGLVVLASGYARAGRTGQGGNDTAKANDAATYKAVGVAVQSVTGSVTDGEIKVDVDTGVFNFVNSAGVDAVGQDEVGRPCYVVDDQTVAATSAGGTRAQAGLVVAVDTDGVWVLVGPEVPDLRRVVVLPFFINETDTLAGTAAELVSPVKGEIISLTTIVQKAVTTGGDVTLAVGVTAVDGLACTIADAAAKGSVVTDRPTAGHASSLVSVGDRIQVAPAAAFATAGAVSGFVAIAI